MSIEIVLAVVLGGALVLIALLDRRGRTATSEAIAALVETSRTLAAQAHDSQVALALVKGVLPHHAAPETFNPRGVSWDTVERLHEATSGAQTAIASDDVLQYEQAAEVLRQRASAAADTAGRDEFLARAEAMQARLEAVKARRVAS